LALEKPRSYKLPPNMEAALFVALFMVFLPSLSSDAIQKERAARDRDLARYKHHPEANLLRLND